MRWKIVVMCLFLGLSITSCGGDPGTATFLEYQRSGGFLGLEDHLTIVQAGKVILERKGLETEFQLDSEAMSQLETLLSDAQFTELEDEYFPERQGSDLIEYTIRYSGHTVRMMDTAIPETLYPVLESLNRLVENGVP